VLVSIAEFFALGALFGFCGGMFGIGGGLIAIPILGIFFDMTEQQAQGTALVMIIPNVAVGLYNYLRAVKIDWRLVGILIVTSIPVTALTARFATLVPSRTLRYAFVVFLLVLAAYIAYRALRLEHTQRRAPLGLGSAAVLGAVTGVLSGLFTIGGAIFSVPVFTTFFGMTQLAAQATSLAFVTPGAFISLAVYGMAGDIDWAIGLPLAVGGVLAVPYGVRVARQLPDRNLRLLFVAFVVVCSTALFIHASTTT
jgi:uncharacterized membrane protein YfcA